MPRKKPDGEKPIAVDDFDLGEGTMAWADTGIMPSEIPCFFDYVTEAHREKARKYWAKIDAAKNPSIEQSLF